MKEAAAEGWKILRKLMNERMVELDLNHNKLSLISGIDRSAIKRYLEGDREPSITNFLALLGSLDLRPYIVPKEIDKNTNFNYLFFN